jgi:hypothetical protein
VDARVKPGHDDLWGWVDVIAGWYDTGKRDH